MDNPSDCTTNTTDYVSDSELPIMINDHPHADITRNPPDVITLTSYVLGIILGIFVGNLPILKFKCINFYIIALCWDILFGRVSSGEKGML